MKNTIIFFVLLLSIGLCYSAFVSWTGGAGNWNDATKWSTMTVPAVGDDVTLAAQFIEVSSAVPIPRTISIPGGCRLTVRTNFATTGNVNITGTTQATIRVVSGVTFTIGQNLKLNSNSRPNMDISGTCSGGLEVLAGTSPTLTSASTAGGAFTVLGGTRDNIIRTSLTFPPTGWVWTTDTHTVSANGGPTSITLTFQYRPTMIGSWILDNEGNTVNINFEEGVNFQVATPFLRSNGAVAYNNKITVSQTVSSTVVSTITAASADIVQQNGANVFSGSGVVFSVDAVTVNTAILQTNSAVTLTTPTGTPSQTVAIGQDVEVGANFIFSGVKTFSGSKLTITDARTVNTQWTVGNEIVFSASGVVLGSASNFIGGGGVVQFVDSMTSTTTSNIQVSFRLTCTAGTFTIGGSGSVLMNSLLIIKGCAVTSTPTWTLRAGLNTMEGNSTIPTQMAIDQSITFSRSGTAPTNSLYSITIPYNTLPGTGTTWTISNVALITPTGAFTIPNGNAINGNGLLVLSGTGTFTLSGTAAIATEVAISGTRTISANSGYIYGSNLLLRGATVTATNDFRFTGSIKITEGVSTIANTNFRFDATLSVSLQFVGNNNRGGRLDVAGDRTIDTNFAPTTARLAIRFPGNIVFNSSANFNFGSGTVTGASIEFSGATLSSTAQTSLMGNITFLNNIRLIGGGSFQITATQLNLYGGINIGTTNGDTTVFITSTTVMLYADVTLGALVDFKPTTIVDDDLDDMTVTRTATLQAVVNNPRDIQALILKANLIVEGAVRFVSTTTYVDNQATLTLTGGSIALTGSPTFRTQLVITAATTISAITARTFTVRDNSFNIPATLTVNSPVTLSLSTNAHTSCAVATCIAGTSSLVLGSNTYTATTGTATLTANTISVATTTNFVGSFTLVTLNGDLALGSFTSTGTTTYAGPKVTFSGNPTIPENVVFSAANLELVNSATFSGPHTVTTNWEVNGALTFNNVLTLNGQFVQAGTGSLRFNQALVNNADKTIWQPVTFGTGVVAVSSTGTISLQADSITILGTVVSSGGNIQSIKQGQILTGGGSIPSQWTWTTSLEFRNVNVTGARTITRVHTLNAGTQYTNFVGGLTMAANGGFQPLTLPSGLGVEVSFTSSVAYTMSENINLRISGKTFTFDGAATLTTKSRFICESDITFTTAVVFREVTSTTAQPILFETGCAFKGAALDIWRVLLTTNVATTVENALNFKLNAADVVFNGGAALRLNGNIEVAVKSIAFSTNTRLGSITVNSLNNNTLTNVDSVGIVTFTSVAPIEPRVTFTGGNLDFTISLTGPVLLPSTTLATGASIEGAARVAFANSLTVTETTSITAPVQLYIETGVTTFTLSISNNQELALTNPSLFNPIGNVPLAITYTNTGTFELTSSNTFGDVFLNANGFFKLVGGTVTFRDIFVNGNATLWLAGATVNARNVQFTQSSPVPTQASNFHFTLTQNPPLVLAVSNNVIYAGVAIVDAASLGWNGQQVTAITAGSSSNTDFLEVTGEPGYTYASVAVGAGRAFTRSQVPTDAPAPTQSNGPTPAVSSAPITHIFGYLTIIASAIACLILA